MTWMTHNPAFLSPEDIVQQFVVREHELNTVLRVLRENTGPNNQHMLVIAPRGRGKSMLVHRVAAELGRDPALSAAWFPVLFGEESYNVATPGEFWLEALLHLADASGDSGLRLAYERLHKESDERRLLSGALGQLRDFADAAGKRLMLVVENLDEVLGKQMQADDGWVLRKTLLDEPRLMLLGTAVHRFPGIEQPDQAMFDLFRRVELPPLDDEACQALCSAVVGSSVPFERAAAMRVLTGGNPRLLVLLAGFSRGRDLRTLVDELTHLIDQHTDYFKHNIEALSPQQRRVFTALAQLWAPSTTSDVAAEARMERNVVSTQLGRLEADGRIEVVGQQGRSKLYQLTERLYNIYHLMRRRGGVESRVRALLDFMRHFYEPEELPDVLGGIASQACGLEPGRREEHLYVLNRMMQDWRVERGSALDIARALPSGLLGLPDLPEGVRQEMRAPEVLLGLLETAEPPWSRPAIVGTAISLFGLAGDCAGVLSLLSVLLEDATVVAKNIDALRRDAMRLAAAGHPAETLALLRDSPAAQAFEPLLVALADLSGEPMQAPQEVREVAKHVRTRIELLAETGDIWRTDPMSLPIVRPAPTRAPDASGGP